MKANRKFRNEDDAVSPVIAVILMVAITVVLAATVFVLVSDIGGQSGKSAPQVNFTPDEAGDNLTVSSAGPGANWNRLEIKADKTNLGVTLFSVNYYALAADTGNTTANGFKILMTTSTVMKAGDFISVCGRNAGNTGNAAGTDVTVTIRDQAANSQLGSWLFQSIHACT